MTSRRISAEVPDERPESAQRINTAPPEFASEPTPSLYPRGGGDCVSSFSNNKDAKTSLGLQNHLADTLATSSRRHRGLSPAGRRSPSGGRIRGSDQDHLAAAARRAAGLTTQARERSATSRRRTRLRRRQAPPTPRHSAPERGMGGGERESERAPRGGVATAAGCARALGLLTLGPALASLASVGSRRRA